MLSEKEMVSTFPVTTASEEDGHQILQTLGLRINRMTEQSDRRARLRALQEITKMTIDNSGLDKATLKLAFTSLLKPLLKLLGDDVETMRENAVLTLTKFLANLNSPDYLPFIIPVLKARLGTSDIVEHSEEIRLHGIKLLENAVHGGNLQIAVYMNDISDILLRTLADRYSEVIKVSCKVISALSKISIEMLKEHCEPLSKSLAVCLLHRHAAVRVAAVQAFNRLIYSDPAPLNEIALKLSLLTSDSSTTVREALYRCAGDWLVNLMDRHVYGCKILPMLLLHDKVLELDQLRTELLHAAGEQWKKDNIHDQRVKDEVDYIENTASTSPRPLAARMMIRDNISKILPGIITDLTSWSFDTKMRAANVLEIFMQYAEDHVVTMMANVLSALFKCIHDDNIQLRQQVLSCAKLIGKFGKAGVIFPIVLAETSGTAVPADTTDVDDTPNVGVKPLYFAHGSSAGSRAKGLLVLAALIEGIASTESLWEILPNILSTLVTSQYLDVDQDEFVQNLFGVARSILGKSELWVEEKSNRIDSLSWQLFWIFQHVLAWFSRRDEKAAKQFKASCTELPNDCLKRLAELSKLKSTAHLYSVHFEKSMQSLQQSQLEWTPQSRQFDVFSQLLLNVNPDVLDRQLMCCDGPLALVWTSGVRLDAPQLSNVIRHFEILDEFFAKFATNGETPVLPSLRLTALPFFVQKLIRPCLVWKGGRQAELLRSYVAGVALRILQAGLWRGSLSDAFETKSLFLDVFKSCLSLDCEEKLPTRIAIAQIFGHFLTSFLMHIDEEMKKELYNYLLKALDDPDQKVRFLVADTWKIYFQQVKCRPEGVPSSEDGCLDKTHFEYMIKGVLLHMDDSDPEIQQRIMVTLKEAGQTAPLIVQEILQPARTKHRTTNYIDEVLQSCSI